MTRLTLEERLRPLSLEDRQVLRKAENARIRQAGARSALSDQQMVLKGLVKILRNRGVPAKTIALALGVSKAWVIRCGA